MNKKLIGTLIGTFAIGGLTLAHADEAKPAEAPKAEKAAKKAGKKGEHKADHKGDAKGGEKSCGADGKSCKGAK